MEDIQTRPPSDPRNDLFDSIVKKLHAAGASAEVHRDVYVGYRGKLYRPFVVIPTAGLVLALDPTAEELVAYKKLGLTALDVRQRDLESDNITVISESIAATVAQTKLEAKKRTLIRVNLCYGRRTVKAAIEAKGPAEMSLLLRNPSDPVLENIRAYPSYGGFRIILRPKRKKTEAGAA